MGGKESNRSNQPAEKEYSSSSHQPTESGVPLNPLPHLPERHEMAQTSIPVSYKNKNSKNVMKKGKIGEITEIKLGELIELSFINDTSMPSNFSPILNNPISDEDAFTSMNNINARGMLGIQKEEEKNKEENINTTPITTIPENILNLISERTSGGNILSFFGIGGPESTTRIYQGIKTGFQVLNLGLVTFNIKVLPNY